MVGLTTDEVAVIVNRCLPIRYSTPVMVTTSAGGSSVTVVKLGAELTFAELVITSVKLRTAGAAPTARIGAENVG